MPTLEILDQIGLADEALRLPHTKLAELSFQTPRGRLTMGGFRRLKTRFPFITIMPQVHFLDFMVGQARRYPNSGESRTGRRGEGAGRPPVPDSVFP